MADQERNPSLTNGEGLQTSKRKRGWIEIIGLILSECIDGSVKTRIMYRCNLNSKQMQQNMSFLLDCNFLEGRQESDHVTTVYYTTDLGISFIRKYQELQKLLQQAIADKAREIGTSISA